MFVDPEGEFIIGASLVGITVYGGIRGIIGLYELKIEWENNYDAGQYAKRLSELGRAKSAEKCRRQDTISAHEGIKESIKRIPGTSFTGPAYNPGPRHFPPTIYHHELSDNLVTPYQRIEQKR